jgi:hypothetical protein
MQAEAVQVLSAVLPRIAEAAAAWLLLQGEQHTVYMQRALQIAGQRPGRGSR